MKIMRSGRPSMQGPTDWFSGHVRVDPVMNSDFPERVQGAHVTFDPSARTAWHTHPLGQTIIVTVGVGLVQRWGGPIEEIRAGDVVFFEPGEKHWHGAAAKTGMSHTAIQEVQDGKVVDWMEHVSDSQYNGEDA